jgi:hypothetical protein|tara:strand:+ start:2477 stop:2620 length:144 start_codon:yes stop_codon:yes gene_type:complete
MVYTPGVEEMDLHDVVADPVVPDPVVPFPVTDPLEAGDPVAFPPTVD